MHGRHGFSFVDCSRVFGHPGANQAKPSSKVSRDSFRRHLSTPGMLRVVRECFDRVPDPVRSRDFSLSDCLMSGLAVFSLKTPSLLQFDMQVRGGEDPVQARNLRSLFGVGKAPSDTRMRERLDEVDPRDLRRCFKQVHAALQRGKVLEGWTVLGGHLLIWVDGTGHHSSHKVSCRRCCVKSHRDGSKTYCHQRGPSAQRSSTPT